MQSLPHHYTVTVSGDATNPLHTNAKGLATLSTAAPAAFGGPGTLWSPEDLLMASVANCLVLSFRAIARASKFEWLTLECTTEGTLDRIDGVTRFTEIHSIARLRIAADANADTAEKLLNKAESTCLISNSLNATSHLKCEILKDV